MLKSIFLKIYIACMICLSILFFNLLHANANNNLPLAREYKVLLDIEKLDTKDKIPKVLIDTIKTIAFLYNVEYKELENIKIKNRAIKFIDTDDFNLYKNGFILRERMDKSNIFEYTLKFRTLNLKDAQNTKLKVNKKFNIDKSFEEDIIYKNNNLVHVYTKSVKFESNSLIERNEILNLFPVILNVISNSNLKIVNNAIINEKAYEFLILKFPFDIKAKCVYTVWANQINNKPFIVEFSFKYKFDENENIQNIAYVHHLADKLFTNFCLKIKPYIAIGKTKTSAIYNITTQNESEE